MAELAISDKTVSMPPNFWPLFFTSSLMRQLVGETTCFCLNDKKLKAQFIVVIPAFGATQLPSVDALKLAFPPYGEGRPYCHPDELPVSPDDLAQVTQFSLHKEDDGAHRLYVLVPRWESRGELLPERFYYLRFESVEKATADEFLAELSSEEIVAFSYCDETGEMRCLFFSGARFDFSIVGETCRLSTAGGDRIIPLRLRKTSGGERSGRSESPVDSFHQLLHFPAAEDRKKA